MKIKRIIIISGFLILILVTGIYYFLLPFKIDIISTNDLHGQISVLPKISAYIKNLKSKHLLLLDSGDFIQGTPETDFFQGESIVKIFNLMNYDGAVLGNHEFDFGEENVKKLRTQAKFYFLGSNIYDNNGKLKSYVEEFFIKDFNGVKVGVFGLLTKKTKDIVLKEHLKNIEILDEQLVAERIVKKLKYQGADIIICVSHIGWRKENKLEKYEVDDFSLAEKVKDISVILGGHTHNKYCKKVGNTILLQSGGYGKYFAHLTLYVSKKSKKILFYKNKFIPTKDIKLPSEPAVELVVNEYSKKVESIFNEPVGEAAIKLTRDRKKESLLGNLICDIIASRVECDFAVTNSGGIRADIEKGKVLYRNLYLTCPFDNTIVTTVVSGEDIVEMFEYSVVNDYGILQVSKNIKVVYDMKKPKNKKVVKIEINNQPVNLKKTYIVATNNFVASGGDGYHWFTKNKVHNTKIKLRDAIKDYFKRYSPVSANIEHRIIFLN